MAPPCFVNIFSLLIQLQVNQYLQFQNLLEHKIKEIYEESRWFISKEEALKSLMKDIEKNGILKFEIMILFQ